MSEEGKWYFSEDDDQKGPFSREQMAEMVQNEKITGETLVWMKGFEKWEKARDTDLGPYFDDLPPPLAKPEAANKAPLADMTRDFASRSANRVLAAAAPLDEARPDVWAWGMLITWAVYCLIKTLWLDIGVWFTVLFLCAYAFFVLLDVSAIRKVSAEPFSYWRRAALGLFLAPVYLYKRASWTGRKRTLFYAWLAAFFLILLSVAAVTMYRTGFSPKASIEANAPAVVNQILNEELTNSHPNCKSVEVTQKVSDRLYNALAYLDDGHTIEISVRLDKDDDTIYVEIPYMELLKLIDL
jgi:hypothetical protein